ncbi:MAG TPA: SusC/RagA family TonB-linked outer membrane protein, partial [Puia sp.]|nr:SusC/RagA family TonB-linked outer membrane protein [Puia sp.]
MVTDELGTPLSGASVKIKGSGAESAKGAITDRNGHFAITGPEGTLVLIVTYIGYQPQELTVQAGTTVTVHLKPAQNSLDEMVIVGYGVTSRRLNTGSVSSITAADIGKETVTNPITALQGHIAGMQITQDNGLPGGGVRVNIRGAFSTVSSAGFLPLYVVDGVPFTLFNGGQPATDGLNAYGVTGANGSISPFSLIDPADIDRVDVLKDADATAIYGSRGANGVILITTKKGGRSKTVYSVNAYTGIEKAGHYIPMMNTAQYLQMRREAFANAGVTPTAANAKDLVVWDPNAFTDWQKWAIGGTAPLTNVNASVSGGNPQNSFIFSSTYRHEGSVFRGPFDATTISNRLTAGHISEDRRFSINGSVSYASMVNNLPSIDMSTIYNLAPNYPLYNSDGTLNWTSTNPLSYLKQPYNATSTNLITNMTLSYKLITGLVLKTDLGYSLTRLHQTQASPASTKNPAASPISSLSYADNDNGNYIVEPQVQYNRLIGGGKLDVLGGATFQQNKSTGVYLYGTGFSNEALINSLTAASSVITYNNNNSLYKYNAFFGRINYSFADKYILDLTGRRDGSSRFGPGHRFGNFGAVGAAWVLSQEGFMKRLPFVSFAKLRASYGLTGNDQIPNYQYFPTYSAGTSTYAYQGAGISYPSNIANPDLQWETRKKGDIALELGFFHDRLSLKTDFYRDRTSNLLTYISTPAQIGTTAYYGNFPALIQNQGFEFELNTVNLAGKNLRWTTAFNLTLNANKLISYPGLATSSYSTTYKIGRPTDITWLYHYTGTNPATGLPTFQDLNKDGVITTADREPVKYGTPCYGGMTNDISYKGFDLNLTFQFYRRYAYTN